MTMTRVGHGWLLATKGTYPLARPHAFHLLVDTYDVGDREAVCDACGDKAKEGTFLVCAVCQFVQCTECGRKAIREPEPAPI